MPPEPERLTAERDDRAAPRAATPVTRADRGAGGVASRPDPLPDPTTTSAPVRAQEPEASPTRGRGAEPAAVRARQVQRIVRYIDPWSALKVAFLFFLCLWGIVLVAGVILWTGATTTGVVDNVEGFVEDLFGLERFEFDAGQMLRGTVAGGFVLAVAGTAFSMLFAVLFNLISDITGGLRLTMLELDRTGEGAGKRRRRGRRTRGAASENR